MCFIRWMPQYSFISASMAWVSSSLVFRYVSKLSQRAAVCWMRLCMHRGYWIAFLYPQQVQWYFWNIGSFYFKVKTGAGLPFNGLIIHIGNKGRGISRYDNPIMNKFLSISQCDALIGHLFYFLTKLELSFQFFLSCLLMAPIPCSGMVA